MSLFFKIITVFILFSFLIFNSAYAATPDVDFSTWLNSFKKNAMKNGISRETIDIAFKDVKFLKQVIKYDRQQPEFIEDTNTYVNKRATNTKAKKAIELLKKNSYLFNVLIYRH